MKEEVAVGPGDLRLVVVLDRAADLDGGALVHGGHAANLQLDSGLCRVGLESIGVEEFIEGKFFDGELFVDNDKQSYKEMGFQRFSFLSLFSLFRSKKWTDAGAMAKKMNLGGNMTKGDGFQLGGAIVVDVGGKTLYTYAQEDAADHVENGKVLQALHCAPLSGKRGAQCLGIDAPVPHGIEQF